MIAYGLPGKRAHPGPRTAAAVCAGPDQWDTLSRTSRHSRCLRLRRALSRVSIRRPARARVHTVACLNAVIAIVEALWTSRIWTPRGQTGRAIYPTGSPGRRRHEGDQLSAVSSVDDEMRIGGEDPAMRVQFCEPNQAGIGERHRLVPIRALQLDEPFSFRLDLQSDRERASTDELQAGLRRDVLDSWTNRQGPRTNPRDPRPDPGRTGEVCEGVVCGGPPRGRPARPGTC